MATSYKTQAIVLRKTKLREKDLILTLLAQDGSQVRCVAKGAQKPGSTFSARLEVFSVVDLLLYPGKNLDTITEVRSVSPNESCRTSVERMSYGAVMAELLQKVALEGQEMPVLFPLTQTALSSLGNASLEALPFLTSAFLIKVIAVTGLRPSFDECVSCGQPMEDGADQADDALQDMASQGVFSIEAGGWLCPVCEAFERVNPNDVVAPGVAAWVKALLGMRFVEVEQQFQDASAVTGSNALAGQLLDFCERWLKAHLGVHLKSLEFLSRI